MWRQPRPHQKYLMCLDLSTYATFVPRDLIDYAHLRATSLHAKFIEELIRTTIVPHVEGRFDVIDSEMIPSTT